MNLRRNIYKKNYSKMMGSRQKNHKIKNKNHVSLFEIKGRHIRKWEGLIQRYDIKCLKIKNDKMIYEN